MAAAASVSAAENLNIAFFTGILHWAPDSSVLRTMHQRLLVIDGRSRTGPVTSVLTKKHLLGQALFQDTKKQVGILLPSCFFRA